MPQTLPEDFRQIRLELAREPGHPDGSADIGYELTAPLDAQDHLDPNAWRSHRGLCRVRRFRPGEDDEIGLLVRRPGGHWVFDYDADTMDEDERAFRLGGEAFRPGEYISVSDASGTMHTYRVVAVREP